MRPAKVEPGDSHVRENFKGADFLQDIRFSRQLMRKHDANRRRRAYPTRTSVKICGKRLTENDSEMLGEVEVDYKCYLAIIADRLNCVSDDDMGYSDVDNNINGNSFNDEDYLSFLDSNMVDDGNLVCMSKQGMKKKYKGSDSNQRPCSRVSSVAKKPNNDVYCDPADEDYLSFLDSDMVDNGNFVRMSQKGTKKKCKGSDSNQRLCSHVSAVAKKPNSDVDCDPADEDYLSFLDSDMVDAGNLVSMSEKGMKKKCKGSDSNQRPRAYVSSVAKKPNSDVDCDPADEDYLSFLDSDMVDDGNLVSMSEKGMKKKCKGSDSNQRPRSYVSSVAKKPNSDLDCDPADEDYLSFLDSDMVDDGNLVCMSEKGMKKKCKGSDSNKWPRSHVSSVAKEPNNDVECDPADEDYQQFLDSDMVGDETLVCMSKQGIRRKCDESNSGREKIGSQTESGNNLKSDKVDDRSFICIPRKGTERKCEESDLGGEKAGRLTESGKNLKSEGDVDAEEGKFSIDEQNLLVSDWAILPSNSRPRLDISSVAKHKCHSEVQCDTVDEDYQEFLSSTIIYEEEEDCSSSDSELVIMESDPYHENTPFISSKIYDPSWFADEGNRGDNWLLSATRDSQFRKGLMEFLERPYDQGEYERYLQEISCQKQKERHRETRSGEIESCPVVGVNKSYLELHEDLKEAIDGAKEQHKVLFLLRGYFYWLEHLTQEGSFQPWTDASCLEILTKM